MLIKSGPEFGSLISLSEIASVKSYLHFYSSVALGPERGFVTTIWILTSREEYDRQDLCFTCWIKMVKDLFPKYLKSKLHKLKMFTRLVYCCLEARLAKGVFYNRTAVQKFPRLNCSDFVYDNVIVFSFEVMEQNIHLIPSWSNFPD